MRIAFSGTSSSGKTTTIKHFLEKWNNYSLISSEYRKNIKDKKHSKNTTAPIQKQILDSMCDECKNYTLHQKVVFDRCPLDNLVYTMWCYEKGMTGFDQNFMDYTLFKVRESMKNFDVIFLCTRDMMPAIEDDGKRETDPTFIEEIDNIFKAILTKYKKGAELLPFFDQNDAPAIIDIYGQPFERIAQISMYVTEDGDAFGEDQSLIDINELSEMNKLLREQGEAIEQENKNNIILHK